MATTPSGIYYPTNADAFTPATDMEALANSITHIVPVANAAERDAVAQAYDPSPDRPLYVDRADTGTLERSTGNGWEYYSRPRRLTGSQVFTPSTFGPMMSATADIISGSDGNPQTVTLNVRIGGPHDTISAGGVNVPLGTVSAEVRPSSGMVFPVLFSVASRAATGTVASDGILAVRWASDFIPNQTVLSALASYPIR